MGRVAARVGEEDGGLGPGGVPVAGKKGKEPRNEPNGGTVDDKDGDGVQDSARFGREIDDHPARFEARRGNDRCEEDERKRVPNQSPLAPQEPIDLAALRPLHHRGDPRGLAPIWRRTASAMI